MTAYMLVFLVLSGPALHVAPRPLVAVIGGDITREECERQRWWWQMSPAVIAVSYCAPLNMPPGVAYTRYMTETRPDNK